MGQSLGVEGILCRSLHDGFRKEYNSLRTKGTLVDSHGFSEESGEQINVTKKNGGGTVWRISCKLGETFVP
jgi:hypothetical protein